MKKIFFLIIVFILFLTIFPFYNEDNSLIVSKNEDNDIKYIAFTFDDGPSRYTNELLDGLKERDVKVTFFLLGHLCERYPETLKRIVLEGHQIGNHGYDHRLLTRLKPDEIEFQINKTNEIIKRITGVEPTIIRPAYGIYNDHILKPFKMPIILWSIDTLDWRVRNSKRIYRNNINKISDGDIILFHDKFKSSIKGALMLIDELKDEGFEFLTISDLAKVKDINLEKNKEYFYFSNPMLKIYPFSP